MNWINNCKYNNLKAPFGNLYQTLSTEELKDRIDRTKAARLVSLKRLSPKQRTKFRTWETHLKVILSANFYLMSAGELREHMYEHIAKVTKSQKLRREVYNMLVGGLRLDQLSVEYATRNHIPKSELPSNVIKLFG